MNKTTDNKQNKLLIKELELGEESKMISHFDSKKHLQELHRKFEENKNRPVSRILSSR